MLEAICRAESEGLRGEEATVAAFRDSLGQAALVQA